MIYCLVSCKSADILFFLNNSRSSNFALGHPGPPENALNFSTYPEISSGRITPVAPAKFCFYDHKLKVKCKEVLQDCA